MLLSTDIQSYQIIVCTAISWDTQGQNSDVFVYQRVQTATELKFQKKKNKKNHSFDLNPKVPKFNYLNPSILCFGFGLFLLFT